MSDKSKKRWESGASKRKLKNEREEDIKKKT